MGNIWQEWKVSVENVDRTVHPNDEMMIPGHEESYWLMGDWAVRCVQAAVKCAELSFDVKTETILDLPCGYGRVLRFLQVAYPDADITACDISKEGVDFCVETFGVRGIYSSTDPSEIDAETYDVIWCGSLLTHMPEEKWEPWLSFFETHLNPGGTVVFTTHGEGYARGLFSAHMPANLPDLQQQYWERGFAFSRNDIERDEDPGIALSSPRWILEKLSSRTHLRVTAFMERGWHDAHDVWAVTRATDSSLQRDRERVAVEPAEPVSAAER
jgi:cyclopropane fatty-acyl-phospholipid synthase-like methyltransferase